MHHDAPAPPPLPVDPNLAAEQETAHQALIQNLQGQAQEDTASIMARYGIRLAMSGAVGGSTGSLLGTGFQSGAGSSSLLFGTAK